MTSKELCRWIKPWIKNKNHNFQPSKYSFPCVICSKCGLYINHFGKMADKDYAYIPKKDIFGSPSKLINYLRSYMPHCGVNTTMALFEL